MGVNSISGAYHGPVGDYHFDWSNKSSIMRMGAIMCHKVGGAAEDVVVYGEATAGEIIGPCLGMGRDPALTSYLPVDGDGICSAAAAQSPARSDFILAANSGAVAVGDYLIPTGAVGAVIPRPIGSSIPPVGRAVVAVADSASERYIYGEVLTPGIGTTGQRIMGWGNNAPTNNYSMASSNANHVNGHTPLFVVPAAGVIRNLFVKGKTAGGAGKTITFTVHKSSDGGTTWTATTLTCALTGTNTTASDTTHAPAVAAGDLLEIIVTSADVGALDADYANFIYE